jgi:phage tail sheath gpL-like
VAWHSFDKPNVNMDGVKLALYAPQASLAFIDTEVESHLANGVTPLTPTSDGRLKIEKLVTTRTTISSAPFEGLADAANIRTSAYMGRQISAGYAAGFQQENLVVSQEEGLSVLQRIRDMVIEKHRAAETLGILREVDSFLPQIVVEEAVSPPGRTLTTSPFKIAGPLHQSVFKHIQYV